MKSVDGGEQAVTESFKYKAMVNFIFKHITESDHQLFLKLIKGNEKIDSMLNAISSITPDARITDSEREKFKAAFEKLITTNEIKVGKLKNDILRFVYLVRNNIFHGTKNTIEMTENFQRKRLLIYTNILIAVNELLFKALEQTIEFKPHSNYHLSPK